jgi:GTPase
MPQDNYTATVALIGRPNVGKSTLFNRLVGKRQAIVDDRPGVTRDLVYGRVSFDAGVSDNGFYLIDTGGYDLGKEAKRVKRCHQSHGEVVGGTIWPITKSAIEEADVCVFVLDGKFGLHPLDHEILSELRKTGKEVIYVVNKIDGYERSHQTWDFLGFTTDLLPVSSAHGMGLAELRCEIRSRIAGIRPRGQLKPEGSDIKIAMIGRPNMGKSSIINRLTGRTRALVSELPGTTRDSLDTSIKVSGRDVTLVDTAGIRRQAKVKDKIEGLSVLQSIKSVERADIVLLIIDAAQGLTDQDARLADHVIGRGKPLMIVVNKWDLIGEKDANSCKVFAAELRAHLKSMAYVPIKFVSCLKNQRVHQLLDRALALHDQALVRIDTTRVNEALKEIVAQHTPALIYNHTKQVKFYFASQVGTNPPKIVIFCNVEDEIQESYKRYMENRFREKLGFPNLPLKLVFRDHKRMRERPSQALG